MEECGIIKLNVCFNVATNYYAIKKLASEIKM